MFKVLLVDDERHTREGIYESIDRSLYDISEIRTAEDGLEALAIAKVFLPDILITDIKMPKMNGIDLSREIKKICPDISIVFLSAYSDKEFYRSAIDISVVKYVEKPIETDELDSAISLAVARRRQIKNNLIHYENDIALELTLKKTENVLEHRDIEKYLGGAEFDSCFTVVTTSPDGILFESLLYAYAIMDKIKTDLNVLNYKFLTSYKDNYLIFHFFMKNELDAVPSSGLVAEALYSFIKPYFYRFEHLYLGCGSTVCDAGELYISYNQAMKCVQNSFFFPNRCIFFGEEKNEPTSFDHKLIGEFSTYIKSGDKPKTLKTIEKIYSQIKARSSMGKEKALDIYLKLFFETESVKTDIAKTESNSGPELPAKTAAVIMNAAAKSTSLDKLNDELILTVNVFFDEVFGNKPLSTARAIKEIINERYHDKDLSLNTISKKIFLSSSYICIAFKKETGMTIMGFLNKTRIEKSLAHLADKNASINEVAQKVGYENGNYYAKIFRKTKGMSPKQYRERLHDE